MYNVKIDVSDVINVNRKKRRETVHQAMISEIIWSVGTRWSLLRTFMGTEMTN